MPSEKQRVTVQERARFLRDAIARDVRALNWRPVDRRLERALAAAEQRGREDEREARVKVERWLDETLIEWSRGTTYQTGCPVDVHEWWDRYARGDS